MRAGRRHCTVFTPVEIKTWIFPHVMLLGHNSLSFPGVLGFRIQVQPCSIFSFQSLSLFPPLSPHHLPFYISWILFLVSCLASWHQKFDELRLYIIIQINDKIAKTKAKTEPWVKVQKPSLQGHISPYIGTMGTFVHLVIHQPNRSCSQSLFLSSSHKDIEKPYQICCPSPSIFFHPSPPHLVSLWLLLIPPQNVSCRPSSPTSLQLHTSSGPLPSPSGSLQ